MKKIGVFIGSLRKDSFSGNVAHTMSKHLADRYEIVVIEMGDLPLYNEDLDHDNVPASWSKFREEVAAVDAFLFVTPEYNRSVPAVLKNALDVASRPYGQSVWGQKPGAVVSVTPGGLGAFGANHHLRQTLTFLDVYTMQQPEAYISNIAASLEEDGTINEETTNFINTIADSFDAWIKKF